LKVRMTRASMHSLSTFMRAKGQIDN